MQQHQAIRILKQNESEFRTKSAREVLLDIGHSQQLLSAELEKLAQTYNHLAALSHFERAADRGSPVTNRLDVPTLVDEYVKSAAPRDEPKDRAYTLDNLDDIHAHFFPRAKAAAAETAPATEKRAAYEWESLLLAEGPAAVRGQVLREIDAVCSELAKSAAGGQLDIAFDQESATHAIGDEAAGKGGAMLERYCNTTRPRIKIATFNGELRKRAFEVTTPTSERLIELSGLVIFNDLLKQAQELTPEEALALLEGGPFHPGDTRTMGDPDRHYEETSPGNAGGGMIGGPPPGATNNTPQDTPRERRRTDDDEDERGGKGKSKTKSDADTKDRKREGGGALSLLGKAVGSGTRAVNNAAVSGKGGLAGITGKSRVNRDQQDVDQQVADIQRSVQVLRMIRQDPVLREQDAREVIEQYNAIAEVYPEAATNPKRILLALREAGNYQGLTLDTQKTLSDTRKNELQNLKQDRENSDATYRIA